jgi:hypothetical protein
MPRTNKSIKDGKKEKIFKLRSYGYSYGQIQKATGFSKSAIAYHIGDGQKEKCLERNKKLQRGVFRKTRDFISSSRGQRGEYKDNKVTRISSIRKKARIFMYGHKGKRKGTYYMHKNKLTYQGGKIWDYLNKIWPGISLKDMKVQAVNQWTGELDFKDDKPVMYPMVRCKLSDQVVDAEMSDVHCDHIDGNRLNNHPSNFSFVTRRFNAMKEQDNYDQLYDNCKKFIKMYDRVRGTCPAELRSSGPKQRPERVATTLGVRGESARRGVSSDDNVFNDKTVSDDYKSGGAYKAILKMFATQLDDKKFAAHCKKFFKGDNENNT